MIKNISGPVNIIRLEKQINGVKKVIYIMMDFHIKPHWQKECEDLKAPDIKYYMAHQLEILKDKYKDKTYDVFVETSPLYGRPTQYKDNYLTSMRKIFRDEYTRVNKEETEASIDNARLHYVDVREILFNNTWNIIWRHLWQGDLNIRSTNQYFLQTIGYLDICVKEISSVYDHLYTKKFSKIKHKLPDVMATKHQEYLMSEEESEKINKKYIYKLRHDYKNKNVEQFINERLDQDIKPIFDEQMKKLHEYMSEIDKLLEYSEDKYDESGNMKYHELLNEYMNGSYNYGLDNNFVNSLIEYINKSSDMIWKITLEVTGLYLMDLYMMRRFLDKSYITNVISYTGAYHSSNYIRLLIRYFDFNITHWSYMKDDHPKELIKAIKSFDGKESYDNIESIMNIHIYPPEFNQCSNIERFPSDMFE